MYNPVLSQQMAQLDQEYAQKKANIMQSFYNQQSGGWGQQSANTQPAQQPQSTGQNVNWIYVSGVEGAKDQIVQPGQTAWMMDNNDPYIYAKFVDKFGSPEFHAFFIQEVPEEQIKQQVSQMDQLQIDASQYVQRNEFEQLKARLDQLSNAQPKRQQKANKGVEDNG